MQLKTIKTQCLQNASQTLTFIITFRLELIQITVHYNHPATDHGIFFVYTTSIRLTSQQSQDGPWILFFFHVGTVILPLIRPCASQNEMISLFLPVAELTTEYC